MGFAKDVLQNYIVANKIKMSHIAKDYSICKESQPLIGKVMQNIVIIKISPYIIGNQNSFPHRL